VAWFKYTTVVSALTYVVFFALGPGSIPWMITAELFSQGPRPAAISVAVLVNWFCNCLVGLLFPSMQVIYTIYTIYT
jgi:SP family facilitated glucose transporter-like MFS transporter 1